MKLILCWKCSDVVKCGMRRKRYCKCKEAWGKYINDLDAEIGGTAISVCLHNSHLVEAIKAQPESGWGKEFKAWVPAKECSTIRRVNPKDWDDEDTESDI